jgi:DNA-binding SARP family transcriptional activator/predicted ATPase
MPRLSLSLLGPFKATLDGSPVTGFESDKVRALLAYLAAEADRPHRRETLAGLLWPERTDRAASANLRNALANLRRAIGDRGASAGAGPPLLLITRETIQFNREGDQVVDVATFRALLQAGREREPTDDELEQAIALYRGCFLEGLTVRGSPAFDDWSLIVRERCQREMLAALQRLSERYEARGEYGRACDYAWRQVELEPWQEKAHRRLMRLLALDGQRGAALAQYKVCRRQLAEELGVEPARETTLLYERIRDGVETPAPVSTPRHNLPSQLVPLVGREGEVREITARLRDPSCRLLTLVGAGGSGKTRLALEAAARQADDYAQGVFFVPLAPLRSAEGLAPTVAQALGFAFHAGSDPRQQLLDYLRHRNLLLILDNFEHLLSSPANGAERREAAEWVVELLETASGVKALVTSRARLNARGETLLPIGGLDVPPRTAPPYDAEPETEDDTQPTRRGEDAAQYSAVQLFVQSARRLRPGFAPTDEDLWHVAQICQRVAGMPLGILLAASWIEMLSPAQILTQLRTLSIDFLRTNWRDVPERQQSMRAVFDHSWRLLSEREQELFAALSVFRGSFTHQAAQSVTGASLFELMSLVHKSLLQRAST